MGCIFCTKDDNDQDFLKRIVFEDESCYILVDRMQWKEKWGHVLVILKKHISDITDENLKTDELNKIISYVSKTAKALKDLKNELREPVERVYIASLCDGVEHLHFHLIPRYKFTEKDKEDYRNFFKDKKGEKESERIIENIKNNKIGGFWYALREEQNN